MLKNLSTQVDFMQFLEEAFIEYLDVLDDLGKYRQLDTVLKRYCKEIINVIIHMQTLQNLQSSVSEFLPSLRSSNILHGIISC